MLVLACYARTFQKIKSHTPVHSQWNVSHFTVFICFTYSYFKCWRALNIAGDFYSFAAMVIKQIEANEHLSDQAENLMYLTKLAPQKEIFIFDDFFHHKLSFVINFILSYVLLFTCTFCSVFLICCWFDLFWLPLLMN